MSEEIIKVGEINESGLLENLFRKGFSFSKSLSEIHANSIDAKAKNITYFIFENNIRIMDDGCGMNRNELANAFSIYYSNHSSDKSIGVSGIGYKAALVILGMKSDTRTITRKPDGEYLTVEAPWNKIFEIGKYTDMITIRPSIVEEIIEFNKEREKTGNLFGTTTIFKYNDCLARSIELQFEKPISEEEQSIEDTIIPADRFSVIFGRFPQIVSLINKNKKLGASIILSNYDYFNGYQTQFYDGLKREKIIFMKNRFDRKSGEDIRDKYLFIWESSKDGEKYIIKKNGASWKTKAEKLTIGTHKYDEIGEADFICAQRKSSEYFDEENPKIPGSASKESIHPYDKEHIGTNCEDFLANMQIFRNDQMLGICILPGIKISSGRGNPESFHKVILTHCALEYYPISTNNNDQDLIIGIQECKTQFNGDPMPKNLLNLLAHIRNEKAKEIWNYFEGKCEEQKPYSPDSDEERKPYSPHSDEEQKPYSTDSDEERKPYSPHSDEERKPYSPHSDEERKPYSTDSDEEQKPYSTDSDEEQKPYSPDSDEEQKPYSTDSDEERKPYSPHSDEERKPYSPHSDKEIQGVEILSEITKFTSNFDPNMKYTDSLYVELYKLLRKIN
jgi:hypothetical protein